jgi:DNA-directed RNA polymerase specialized sigma24 family protein
MTARRDLERVVPRLRRYARAVVPDPAVADACVAHALARVADVPPAPGDLTLSLFRHVHDALPGRSSTDEDGAIGDLDILDGGVRELGEVERRVLLLNGLEGFARAEIAHIVDRSEGEVTARLDAAYAALQGRDRGRVLLCHGDPAEDERLRDLVRNAGHEVVATAPDGREAIRLVRESSADLLLVDLDCPNHAPCPAALAAVRALDDVGCVAVTEGVDEALSRLADTAAVVISKPVDARLLSVAFAHALRTVARPAAAG